ncbi:hypothetical protein ACQR05_18860 [Bradyrhizobium oligotrophicum]|uniref:hypothetical protein n=1 Tax=Bradyrhizobium oligotrophicum TaxID=44255 RepID=UPI003EBDC406
MILRLIIPASAACDVRRGGISRCSHDNGLKNMEKSTLPSAASDHRSRRFPARGMRSAGGKERVTGLLEFEETQEEQLLQRIGPVAKSRLDSSIRGT